MKLYARYRVWLLGILLVGAVIFTYAPAWHAGFVWDDDKYVTANELLTAPDGLKRIWFSLDSPSQYFPLVYTTFRIEHSLWGLNPGPYHWVNILLHALNALLVWRVLYRLRVPGCWLAAALFALHPVQVESVAWITERKNMLVCLFSLLSALCWINFAGLGGAAENPLASKDNDKRPPFAHPWGAYLLSLCFFALALFSKTTACTLPVAFLIIEWWKRKKVPPKRILQLLPFLLLALAMGLITIWWEQHHQGVKGKLGGIGWLDRILIANRALWFYWGKLIWPANLAFNYPLWKIDAASPSAWVWPVLTLAAAAILAFWRRVNRGIIAAVAFHAITLSPLLGFFMLATFKYSYVADHYQYVAAIGPFALAAAAFTRGMTSLEKDLPLLKPALCGLVLVMLAALSSQQAAAYSSPDTLWRATIRNNPQSFIAEHNLAAELAARGQATEAVMHYRRAFEIQPEPLTGQNLGSVLLSAGQTDAAIYYYSKALELQPDAPSIAFGLGNALTTKGLLDEAIAAYRKALELQPDGPSIASALGNALLAKGSVDEGILYFQKAIQLAPGLTRGHTGLATAFVRKGRLAEAVAEYGKALELQPANPTALNNLAWLLAAAPDDSIRNGERAVALAQKAVELSGERSADALVTLSAALAESGKFPEAVAAAQRALELPEAQANAAFADSIRAKINLYEARKAFRDTSLGGR